MSSSSTNEFTCLLYTPFLWWWCRFNKDRTRKNDSIECTHTRSWKRIEYKNQFITFNLISIINSKHLTAFAPYSLAKMLYFHNTPNSLRLDKQESGWQTHLPGFIIASGSRFDWLAFFFLFNNLSLFSLFSCLRGTQQPKNVEWFSVTETSKIKQQTID